VSGCRAGSFPGALPGHRLPGHEPCLKPIRAIQWPLAHLRQQSLKPAAATR
jgi:hypothetical protein